MSWIDSSPIHLFAVLDLDNNRRLDRVAVFVEFYAAGNDIDISCLKRIANGCSLCRTSTLDGIEHDIHGVVAECCERIRLRTEFGFVFLYKILDNGPLVFR